MDDDAAALRRRRIFTAARVVTLLALLAAGAWAAEALGLREAFSEEGLRQLTEQAGVFGGLAYLAAFAMGQLVQLPGIAFVLGARVAYGPLLGFAAGYAGALLSVSVSFFFARAVGGKALGSLKGKWARRVLSRLEDRPLRTIIVLRTLFALSPPLNYALAMSSTRFRDYFAGSAIGLVAPIAAWVFLSDCLLSFSSGVF